MVSNNSYEYEGDIDRTIRGKELPTQGDAAVVGVDPIDYIN